MPESESGALPLGDTPLYPRWQGWQDLNLRMRKSKSRALPLGDTPTLRAEIGVSKETRTLGLQGHNLAL